MTETSHRFDQPLIRPLAPMSLFRQEFQAAQTTQWLGVVRLHRPMSFAMVTVATIGLALALVAFTTWGEINRKTRLSGLLVPVQGSLNIAAPNSGVVMELPIGEGQTVEAGDVLMVLHSERRSIIDGSVNDANARVAQQIESRKQSLTTERALRELQKTQREQVLSDRIRTTKSELRQAEDEKDLQRRRVQLARKSLERDEQLALSGFVSASQVQTRQEELIDIDARLRSLERAELALKRELLTLEGERTSLASQLQSDLSQIDRTRSTLEQEATEQSARKSTVITAPFAAMVTALNLQPGQSVQTGQNLATLVPVGKADSKALQAHLYAPSRTAGFVQSGQPVFLRYAAYPYQKFGLHAGRIKSVSTTPFAPSELPPNLSLQLLAQAGSQEALYRITVELDKQNIEANGTSILLKPGLTVDADVLQERRKVWEWILEPVLAARQQVKVLGANTL